MDKWRSRLSSSNQGGGGNFPNSGFRPRHSGCALPWHQHVRLAGADAADTLHSTVVNRTIFTFHVWTVHLLKKTHLRLKNLSTDVTKLLKGFEATRFCTTSAWYLHQTPRGQWCVLNSRAETTDNRRHCSYTNPEVVLPLYHGYGPGFVLLYVKYVWAVWACECIYFFVWMHVCASVRVFAFSRLKNNRR